jgi:hypothetical protein
MPDPLATPSMLAIITIIIMNAKLVMTTQGIRLCLMTLLIPSSLSWALQALSSVAYSNKKYFYKTSKI